MGEWASHRNHASLFLACFLGINWQRVDGALPSSCFGASETSSKAEVFQFLLPDNVPYEPPLSEFDGFKQQTFLSHSLEDGLVCLMGSLRVFSVLR